MPGAVPPKTEVNCFDPTPTDEKLLEKMPDWMRPDQVQKVLGGVGRETVRQYRIDGSLVCRDFRTKDAKQPCWRYYKASVREFLAKLPTGKADWL